MKWVLQTIVSLSPARSTEFLISPVAVSVQRKQVINFRILFHILIYNLNYGKAEVEGAVCYGGLSYFHKRGAKMSGACWVIVSPPDHSPTSRYWPLQEVRIWSETRLCVDGCHCSRVVTLCVLQFLHDVWNHANFLGRVVSLEPGESTISILKSILCKYIFDRNKWMCQSSVPWKHFPLFLPNRLFRNPRYEECMDFTSISRKAPFFTAGQH